MDKLLQIKPGKLLLLYFAIIFISILLFIAWGTIVPEKLISFGFTLVVLSCIGGYLFWIYLILYGFKTIDNKNGIDNNLKTSIITLLTILLSFIAFTVINMIDFGEKNKDIPTLISLIISPILTMAFIHIITKLTKGFKFYDKNSKPNLWDYFGIIFTLGFGPLGLLMMHSHLRLILKDQYMLR
ncbi:hypothetical protein [Prolixibacter denitrificans]|nr:hypothetical protein [Prolixibacter denitrificans]GET23324.1 hypothetical protein JCM18694_35700 [Prolixibacter denitrificans]